MNSENLRRAADLCLYTFDEGNPPEWASKYYIIKYSTDDVYVVVEGDNVWCTIKGTEWSFKEWYKNIQFFKKTVEGMGRVHNGFLDNIQGLWDQLIKIPEFNNRFIKFNGHSRGGAIAQIMALRHQLEFGSTPRVYTFGSPRVGNRAWVKAYGDIPTIRICHSFDPIPKVPVINFWHTPKSITFSKRGHKFIKYYTTVYTL